MEGSRGGREITVPEGINIARLLRYGARRLWVALISGFACGIFGLVMALNIRPEFSGITRMEIDTQDQSLSLNPMMPSSLAGLGDLGGSQLPDVYRLLSYELSRKAIHEMGLEAEVEPLDESALRRFRKLLMAKLGKLKLASLDLAPVRLSDIETEQDLGKKELYLRTMGGGNFELLDRDGWLGQRGAKVAEGGAGAQVDLGRLSFTVVRVEDSQGRIFRLKFRPRAEWMDDFRTRLAVEQERRSETVVTVRFAHYYPEIVRGVINSLVQDYEQWMLGQRGQSEAQRQGFLREEIDRRTVEMRGMQTAFYAYREQHKLVDLTSQARILLESIGNYDSQITQNDLTRSAAANAIAALESGDSKSFYATPFFASRQDSVLGEMVAKLSGLEADREAALKVYTEKHSSVQSLDAQIGEMKKSIRQHLETSLGQLDKTGAELKSRLEEKLGEADKMPQEERQLFDLQRQYEASQQLIGFLEQQLAQSEINSASLTSNLKMIDVAEVTDKPVKPKISASAVFGGLLGAALGLAGIMFMFLGHSQVLDAEDAGEAAPLLADLCGKGWRSGLTVLAASLAGQGRGSAVLLHDTPGLDTSALAHALHEAALELGLTSVCLGRQGPALDGMDGEIATTAEYSIHDHVSAAQFLRSEQGYGWLGKQAGSALLCAAPPSVSTSSLGQLIARQAGECSLVAMAGHSDRSRLKKLARGLDLAGVRVKGVILLDRATLGS